MEPVAIASAVVSLSMGAIVVVAALGGLLLYVVENRVDHGGAH